MKLSNIIKLLSVLLCIFALFVACDNTEETTTVATTEQETTSIETEEETRGEILPVLDNFFTFTDVDSWIELGEATRIDGTCVSNTANNEIIILRSAEVDVMNVVTETFTVYNTNLGKVILTFQNSYDYDEYSAFDWDDIYVTDESIKYPESVMKVEVLTLSGYYFGTETFVIKVTQADVKATAEDVFENNEGANYYTINVSCDFYDVAGTKITSTNYDVTPSINYTSSEASYVSLAIGKSTAYLSTETMELIKTINADNQSTIAGYDAETEKYGYFFGTHPVALGGSVNFVEVYDKATGKCIVARHFNPVDGFNASVLENGNVLIQTINFYNTTNSELSCEIEMLGTDMYLNSYILNVKNDTLTEFECNYIVGELLQPANYAEELASLGIACTDNVDNLAIAYVVSEGKADMYQIIVIDNKGKVLFALDKIIPEQDVSLSNGFGFQIIDGGNYLVDLHDIVTPRAIVSADGVIRCYLTNDDYVVGKYIVNEYGIFDFDKTLLYSFEENELTFTTVIGNEIIVSGVVEVYDQVDDEEEETNASEDETGTETDDGNAEEELTPIETYNQYLSISTENNSEFNAESFLEITKAEFIASISTENYLIFKNSENGKYSLYNANLEHVLTTENIMNVYRCDDNYIVSTYLYIDGEPVQILYTID